MHCAASYEIFLRFFSIKVAHFPAGLQVRQGFEVNDCAISQIHKTDQ